jgi:hypothetical protein
MISNSFRRDTMHSIVKVLRTREPALLADIALSADYSFDGSEIVCSYKHSDIFLFSTDGQKTDETKWFTGHKHNSEGMFL